MLVTGNQPGGGCVRKMAAKPIKPFVFKWVNPAVLAKQEAEKKAEEAKQFVANWVGPKLATDDPKPVRRGSRRKAA